MYLYQAQKRKNQGWRYLLVVLNILIFLYLVNSYTLGRLFVPDAWKFNQNVRLALQLIPSALAFFVLLFSIQYLHTQDPGAVFSAAGRIRWRRFFHGAMLWLCFLLLADLLFAWLDPGNYSFHFIPRQFFPLLLIALLLIPFQAGFEELLFRAYFYTGLGILFRSRIIALVLTAAGFGALHLSNPEVSRYGLWETLPYYAGFGLFAGLLVILDDGLELVWGVHAVNNIYSAVLMNYDASVMKTASLWTLREAKPLNMMLAFFAMAILFIFIMAKIYGWKDWKRMFRRLPVRQKIREEI
ncbi:MAG: CPBP family intramembrane metalloprotease [Bacteroidales bacterium]|nr:CPBP family intramembrane metalloprotease [Bacteroidales bacterium]